jgi:protein TonB
MGIRFNRRIRILPGARLTFSKGIIGTALAVTAMVVALGASADDPPVQTDTPAQAEPQRPATVTQPVDPRPIYTAANTPDCNAYYPKEARKAGIQGSTVLLVLVGTNGRVSHVKVESSSGSDLLDVQAAACVIRQGRFEPGKKDGQPVVTWQRMKWTWKLTP